MTTLIVANLDAEQHWARAVGQRPRDLSSAVVRRIALYGTLLRALRPDAERLWLPAPVPVARVPGLPDVELATGPLIDTSAVCSWALAPPVCAKPDALATVARVNSRFFGHEVAVGLGVAIPGTLRLETWDDVRRKIRTQGRWVLKTPLGTAGRGFLHGSRADFDEPHGEARARRLLASCGALLFQPWLRRRCDLGVVVSPTRRAIQVHELLTCPKGRFEGIRLGETDPELARRLQEIATDTAQTLHDAGYDGPFGVDLFIDDDGRLCLSEINARHTFGHVAHALRVLVARPRWGDAPVALRFGAVAEEQLQDALPLCWSEDRTTVRVWMTPG